jgi:hypothetical protein
MREGIYLGKCIAEGSSPLGEITRIALSSDGGVLAAVIGTTIQVRACAQMRECAAFVWSISSMQLALRRLLRLIRPPAHAHRRMHAASLQLPSSVFDRVAAGVSPSVHSHS